MPARTCPKREAKKSTMALPMPVMSKMQPSSTKIGTEMRIKLDMPSSIRPTMTMRGVWVEKAK